MVFDANLVLHDGTAVTADITPTSTTRASGSVVIDLVSTVGVIGLAAILIVTAELAESGDTLQVTIEEATTANGTYREMARFPLLTYGTGMPGTYVIRFDAQRRFIRALINITDSDSGSDFSGTFHILLSQYPFRTV